MKILILGLGNPILSDDGVGFRVAEELKGKFSQQDVTVMEGGVTGLDFLDLLTGYDKAIIVDSIQTREGKLGQIYRLEPEAFNSTQHASTPHDVNFATALELGKKLGMALPQQIVVLAIEVKDVTTYSQILAPEVEQAVPVCVEMIVQELEQKLDT